MTEIPKPQWLGDIPGYTKAQMLQFRRDALEEAAYINWAELIRDGSLLTWGNAVTIGYRVVDALHELKDET